MTALARVRLAAPFDPRFFDRSPLFWPVRRAARFLDGATAFPPVESLGAVFAGGPHAPPATPPVRFVVARPRSRNRSRGEPRPPIDPSTLYDARIVREQVVPTRGGSWHDLLNALVWGTFPLSKLAIHARQHRAITERIAPGARTLPPTRTRELDALALLDEGGVVLLTVSAGAPPIAIVFGHAVYESLALGVGPAIVAALAVDATGAGLGTVGEAGLVHAADVALARILADRTRLNGPDELARYDLTADLR